MFAHVATRLQVACRESAGGRNQHPVHCYAVLSGGKEVGMLFFLDLAAASVVSVGIMRLCAVLRRMLRGDDDSDGGGGCWRWRATSPRGRPDRGLAARSRPRPSRRRSAV